MWCASIVLAALVAACGSERVSTRMDPVVPVGFDDSTAAYPHVLFSDGQRSLNDRCPVRRGRLNARMPALFVNGMPLGFC